MKFTQIFFQITILKNPKTMLTRRQETALLTACWNLTGMVWATFSGETDSFCKQKTIKWKSIERADNADNNLTFRAHSSLQSFKTGKKK